jgi:lipoate synthase
MTEVEFDEKLANFLGSQTNPQLRFICGQVMMSRSTYKNKAEYVKMITEYVKSMNEEQIKTICKENQVPNNLPRFKQLMGILEKKN